MPVATEKEPTKLRVLVDYRDGKYKTSGGFKYGRQLARPGLPNPPKAPLSVIVWRGGESCSSIARMREMVKRRPLRGCGEILVGSSPTLCNIYVAQW